jgi:hypothetical protein
MILKIPLPKNGEKSAFFAQPTTAIFCHNLILIIGSIGFERKNCDRNIDHRYLCM